MPKDYPPWQTVYWYLEDETMDGTLEIAHQEIRKAVRREQGKRKSVIMGIINSCSVRMNASSGIQRGIDGNKNKGSKAPCDSGQPGFTNRCNCTCSQYSR